MNTSLAYLIGMIVGNGEVQKKRNETIITIDIPHKNLIDDEGRETSVYVKSSLADIRTIIEPLIGSYMPITTGKGSTKISFTKPNSDPSVLEINRLICNGVRQQTLKMNKEIHKMTKDENKEFLRGIADVTGYIRRSNIAYGQPGHHRVYIEIPGNWKTLIDIANILKSLDIPIQTIDFGHPNFRDPHLIKYKEGKFYYWKKEHQLKVWANEFVPIGFNIVHKQKALEKLSNELLGVMSNTQTHKFYWQKNRKRRARKPKHPMEKDSSLPRKIKGKHYDSWQVLAKDLGYHE